MAPPARLQNARRNIHLCPPTYPPHTSPRFLEGISKRFLIDSVKKKKKRTKQQSHPYLLLLLLVRHHHGGHGGSRAGVLPRSGQPLWCPPSHKQSGGRLSSIQVLCMRTVCPHTAPQGVVPCSIKKYQLSDFCAQKASEAGFIPRINPREITEAGGTYGLLKLLKSEKSPGMKKVVLEWCMWGQVIGGRADTMGWGKSWGSSLHSSLRCPKSSAPSVHCINRTPSGVKHWWKMKKPENKTEHPLQSHS